MLRVLVFFPYNFLQEKTGATSRFLNNLEMMLSLNWQIKLLCFSQPLAKWSASDKDWLQRRGIALSLYQPWQHPLEWFHSFLEKKRADKQGLPPPLHYKCPPSMLEWVYTEAKKFAPQLFWNNFAPWAPLSTRLGCPSVIDIHDYVTAGVMARHGTQFPQWLSFYKAYLRDELNSYRKYDIALAISEEEQRHFCHLLSKKILLLPPFAKLEALDPKRNIDYELVTVASASQNNLQGLLWFFREVWPDLLGQYPKIKMRVVGKIGILLRKHLVHMQVKMKVTMQVKQTVTEEACLSSIDFIDHSESLQTSLKNCGIFLSVISGGTGAKIKVMEALGLGLAIVGNAEGFRGFKALPFGCRLADSKAVFLFEIGQLLQDKALRQGAESANRAYFLKRHAPQAVEPVFQQIEASVFSPTLA